MPSKVNNIQAIATISLLQNLNQIVTDRIPFPVLSRRKGSLTVEASLVLPVFLFAMLLIAYLGLMIQCQDEVQWAMTRTVREASAEYGASESEGMKNVLYYQAKLSAYLGENILSLDLSDSKFLEENDEIDLVVRYRVKTPFRILGIGTWHFRQRIHTRAFTGVESRESDKEDDRFVYVAETGRVYHEDENCTYLKLSISQMKYEDVSSLRNEGGGKYKPCERCVKEKELAAGAKVWITNYGDRYHSSRSCSGIKRNVEKIRLSEVGKRTPCSKCGKENE
jgi:hypothetical protein